MPKRRQFPLLSAHCKQQCVTSVASYKMRYKQHNSNYYNDYDDNSGGGGGGDGGDNEDCNISTTVRKLPVAVVTCLISGVV